MKKYNNLIIKIICSFMLIIALASCNQPTVISIDNPYPEVKVLQYQIGDIIYIYMQNIELSVIKQVTFTVNGTQQTYTGAFGNLSSINIARVNKNNYLCEISIDDLIFYP